MIQLIEFGNDLIIQMSLDDNGYKGKKGGRKRPPFSLRLG